MPLNRIIAVVFIIWFAYLLLFALWKYTKYERRLWLDDPRHMGRLGWKLWWNAVRDVFSDFREFFLPR